MLRRVCMRGWRRLGALAALSGIGVCVCAWREPSRALQTQKVALPIEVMWPAGTTRTVNLEVADPSEVRDVQFQLHGIEYPGEASVQVNSGPWVPLSNETCAVSGPGAEFGGIGGPVTTLTLTVPLASGAVLPGANRVGFRFDKTNGINSGFRVLALNFVDSAGHSLSPADEFAQADPDEWRPPLDDPADIAEGRRLWKTTTLQESPLGQGKFIHATCSDCHAQDGRDLKYFNYSNYSIESRCRFHGLSEKQGQQIASYIRSLAYPNPGRPWNPPYQPGPGLDARPVEDWSAGAGFSAVLRSDADELRYIFPNGVNAQTIATTATLNTRETPIALPLPDWNHWLPTVHPMDFWGDSFTESKFYGYYQAIRQKLQTEDPSRYLSGDRQRRSPFEEDLYRWGPEYGSAFYKQYEDKNGAWDPQKAAGVYSTAKWRLVKTWELMHEFNLEDKGLHAYGPDAEARTWMTSSSFGAAPASVHIPEKQGECVGGIPLTQHYFTDCWYQLQIILYSGQRVTHGDYPVDWGYVWGVLANTSRLAHVDTGVRMLEDMVKASQHSDNGLQPRLGGYGWSPQQEDTPPRYIQMARLTLAHMQPQERTSIFNALSRVWWQKTRSIPAQAYYDGGIAAPDETPKPAGGLRFVDQIHLFLREGPAYNLDPELISSVRAWAQTTWPRADWTNLPPLRSPGSRFRS